MAIEPIFENFSMYGKKRIYGESFKVDCKSMLASDSVSQVLSVYSTASILGYECLDGQLKCDGRAIFYVCYLSTDGELKKTESSVDFSTAIKDSSIKSGYKANCRVEVLKSEHDLTGASLGLVATLKTSAEILEISELSALSGGDNIIINTTSAIVSKSYGIKEGVYPVEEEFELATEIKEVLSHRASASISSVSCGVGSIIVNGQIYLTLIALQKSEKCSIIKDVRVLPFRMEIECDDAMPAMQATATVIEKGLKTEVLVDEERGKSKVNISLNLHFTGEAWCMEEKNFALDAFSTTDVVKIIKEQVECLKPRDSECVSVGFNGRAGTSELPVGVVLFAVGNEKVQVASSELADGKLKVTGAIMATGYFADGDGKPFARKIETTFDKELDCSLVGELDLVTAKAERVTARLISATEVELDGELVLSCSSKERVAIECIKDVKSSGEKKANTHAISVYIPFEDEELWSLAKRLNVSPTLLVETNPDLTFPLTGKERIVVYRKR